MSIFKRISDVVRSNVNSALDAAEDPRKVLEQTILDMEGEHKKAKQKLLESMTLLKQVEKERESRAIPIAPTNKKGGGSAKSTASKSVRIAL
jgi:phage shock protein A